jgi:hypothetical protein
MIKQPTRSNLISRKQIGDKHIGYVKYNGFIANAPRDEYQADVGYMRSWMKNYKHIKDLNLYPYVLVCIDIFSRYIHIEALKDLTAEDTTKAFAQCVKVMGHPIYVYTDDGSQFKSKFDNYCNEQDIQHITTTKSKAAYAESALYDMKLYFQKKAEKGLTHWTEGILEFNKLWNESSKPVLKIEHFDLTPEMVHNDLGKYDYIPQLRAKFLNNALTKSGNFPRQYPELKVGDKVKIYTGGLEKGELLRKFYNQRENKWTKEDFKIRDIKDIFGITFYYVEGKNKSYLRHELFKV